MNKALCRTFLTATALSTVLSFSAAAQDVPVPAADPAARSEPAETPAETSGQVQDIVVTAQRRSESIQRVPISVTAMDSKALSEMGVRGTGDLAMISPSVTFQKSAGGAGITVRGIGGAQTNTDESVAGIYLDGVYVAAPAAAVFQLVDIERIEVLKGPQGTLFGRNSSSGAVQIITRTPDEQVRASASFGLANYNTAEASASASGPLTDNLFASVSGYYQYQKDGWGKNLITGRDAYLGHNGILRGKLRWVPSDGTEVTLVGSYSQARIANVQGTGIVPGERSQAGDEYPGFYNVNLSTDGRVIVKQRMASLTVSQDLGGLRMLSITSRQWFNQPFRVDADVSRLPINTLEFTGPGQPRRSFSQEFQLQSSPSSPLKWVAGLFYFREAVGADPLISTGTSTGAVGRIKTVSETTVNAYAAFGEATIPLGESTRLTAGLRYGIDDHKVDIAITRGTATTIYPTRTTDDKKLTWRFAVDQQLMPNILGYASYSRGFKSGLYNISNPAAPYVRPQSVDTYEVGLKTDLFNRHVRVNIAGFYNVFDDIQLRAFGQDGLSNFINAAKAHTEGVELDFIVRPLEALTLRGGATYLRGKYTSFPGAPFFVINPAGGLRQSAGDASGRDTVNTPPFVFNVGANYDIPTDLGDFRLSASYQYNDGSYFDPQNRLRQKPYGLLNSEIRWTDPDSALSARIWIRNITDSRYYAAINSGGTGDLYQPSDPRTYGFSVGWQFN